MKFIVYESREGIRRRRVWRWRLIGGNGEIVAHGEGYTRKADAERAIAVVTSSITNAQTLAIEYA